MIFDGRPTDRLTADDLRGLITGGVREDQFVEFKREPYPASDAGKRELLKDVTAFANAVGGYILIGVDENGEGRASELVGVENAEQVRRSMLDRCLTLIDPRLTDLDIGIVPVDGHDIVVCRVPESPRKPHAAVPDREHHYFWLRHQDGVKLMTVAEVREAIAGDAVQRELSELRREIGARREQQLIADERDREVDDAGLLQLQTTEALAEHSERQFRAEVENRPYFRLTATPLPPAGRDIREHREGLARLLTDPPIYRQRGFDLHMGIAGQGLRQTAAGLRRPALDYKHLRLLWNGHMEFWHPADDMWISAGEAESRPVAERPFAPLVLIESTACFVLLTRDLCRFIGHEGEVEFRLGLYGVQGRRILPYAPNTYGRLFEHVDPEGEIGVFREADIRTGPVRIGVDELPDAVVFRLISEVYYRLGYDREHIPYFDAEGRFVQDVEAAHGAGGGA